MSTYKPSFYQRAVKIDYCKELVSKMRELLVYIAYTNYAGVASWDLETWINDAAETIALTGQEGYKSCSSMAEIIRAGTDLLQQIQADVSKEINERQRLEHTGFISQDLDQSIDNWIKDADTEIERRTGPKY